MIKTFIKNHLLQKRKYKIQFYKPFLKNWYMICTRNKLNCYNIAFYHLFHGHALFFTIKQHSIKNNN